MESNGAVFLYLGTFPDEALARAAYQVLKDLHLAGDIGNYDAAIVTKDSGGKVHEDKDETVTRRSAWGGLVIGAAIGLLFPPALLATAAVGATVGGIGGHLAKGLSRSDVKELGAFIDAGEACLLVIGESRVLEEIDKAELRAEKQIAKQLDLDAKDLDEAVREAAREMGQA